MFKTIVKTTPLVSIEASDFFPNIDGDYFEGEDVTFLTTLRALVAPRMKADESIFLLFKSTSYSSTDAHLNSDRVIRGMLRNVYWEDNPEQSGVIHICNCISDDPGDNYACMELLKSSLEEKYPGWHRLERITEFFRKTFYVLCFVNTERKSVLLFTDNMDVKKMHYLQRATLAFLPWYFDPEAGITELEKELFESLKETTPNMYLDCVAKIASQYDFRTKRIRDLLSGFETRYERLECDKIRSEISSICNRIAELNKSIAAYLQDKSNNEIRLLGLEMKIQSEESNDSEIMEYFLCNPKLVLESVTDREMVFSCMDYLSYFDEDMAKQMIDNRRSYVYRPHGRACNNYIPENDMKKLMYAIFIDQTLRMKVCAAYKFCLGGGVEPVAALDRHNYGYAFRECTPNTHIDKYHCIGNYRIPINQLIVKNDYIGAIEQCVASCKSLNFADSTVMAEFMSRLYGLSDDHVNVRCIELPTGDVVTPTEAVKWLNEQEGCAVNE